MAEEQSIVAGPSLTFAQGERRASDFPQAAQISLGDAARLLRKDHERVKKARIVWEN
jgi:hypothetical protein